MLRELVVKKTFSRNVRGRVDEGSLPVKRRGDARRRVVVPVPAPPTASNQPNDTSPTDAVLSWARYYSNPQGHNQQPQPQQPEPPAETPLPTPRYADLLRSLQSKIARSATPPQSPTDDTLYSSVFAEASDNDINWDRASRIPERGTVSAASEGFAEMRANHNNDKFFSTTENIEAKAEAEAEEEEEEEEEQPYFPSAESETERAAAVSAAEVSEFLNGVGCPSPIVVLKQLTQAGAVLEDQALDVVLRALSQHLAKWGAGRSQKERYALGMGIVEEVERCCESHSAGTVSASGMLLCVSCVPLPVKARALFVSFVEDNVRLSSDACAVYLEMLLVFEMHTEARTDLASCLRAGAEPPRTLVDKILRRRRKVHHSKQNAVFGKVQRRESRKRGYTQPQVC